MNKGSRSTVSWLYEFALPHKKGYIASVIFAALGVGFSILPYFCVAQIVIALLRGENNISFYGFYCLSASVFWVLRYIFHGISTSLSHKSTFAVLSEVRLKLTQKLTRLPMGYLLDTPSGRLKNIIVERVDSMETALAHIVPEMGGNILISISTMLYLFILDWRMALAALIPLILGIFCYMAMMSDYENKFSKYVSKNKYLNDTAVEYIGGIEVIKAFNQSALSYEKFTTAAREAADSAISWMRSTLPFFSLAMSVFPAVLAAILPIGTMLYLKGSLSIETFILSIILSLGIMGPLITTISYSDDVAKVSTIVGEVSGILTQPNLVRPTVPAEIKSYDIHLSDVYFRYREKQVLGGINLSIPVGSVTALVGPSGGGKSTIAKLIASLWDVDKGSICIGETDIRKIPLSQLNSIISYVAQDNYLFDESIRDNIRMGRPSSSDEEVEQAARQSGCHDFIMQLENGYETRAGSSGGHLSGGERQRISIARAMLKNAPIIILDEATAYTDPENEAVIQAAVSKLIADKTLIVIAHRLSTITDSDNIVVIENGQIVAKDTHNRLLESSPLYISMWNAHTSARDGIKITE